MDLSTSNPCYSRASVLYTNQDPCFMQKTPDPCLSKGALNFLCKIRCQKCPRYPKKCCEEWATPPTSRPVSLMRLCWREIHPGAKLVKNHGATKAHPEHQHEVQKAEYNPPEWLTEHQPPQIQHWRSERSLLSFKGLTKKGKTTLTFKILWRH